MNKNAFEQLIMLAIRNNSVKDLYFSLFGGEANDYEMFMFQAFANKILAEQEASKPKTEDAPKDEVK